MGSQKVLVEILDTGKDRISPELQKQISATLHEWAVKAKQNKNPWDKIVVAITAEIFKIDLS